MMMTKTTIALAAALFFGVAATAQALCSRAVSRQPFGPLPEI
jgi:hypothetical protein